MDKITKALEQARKQRYSEGLKNSATETVLGNSVAQQSRKDFIKSNEHLKKFHVDNTLLEKNRIINKNSGEDIIQPYKVLRTRLLQIMKEKGWANIAITSPNKDEGKSTVAVNLAISIAVSKKHNATLMDLDLWEPSVHNYFGYKPSIGLEAYYENDQLFENIIVSPELDGLVIAPTSRPLKESSEYLSTERSIELLADAQNILPNTIVVSDLPPLLVSDDAIAFLPFVDAVLLVIREGKTTKDDIEHAIELLENVNIAGIVLNDTADAGSYG